jgi:hypothetical protein
VNSKQPSLSDASSLLEDATMMSESTISSSTPLIRASNARTGRHLRVSDEACES